MQVGQTLTRSAARRCVPPAVALVLLLCTTPVAAQASIGEKTITDQAAGYQMRLAYPQIGLPPADSAMQDYTQALVDDFKQTLQARDPREPPYFAELRYSVVRNDEAVVSILFSYSIYTGGAHPNLAQTAFNFLMPDGVRVFLPDVVGNDGIQRVSDLAVADLTARLTGPSGMSDPAWIRTGAAPYADNFETFELLADEDRRRVRPVRRRRVCRRSTEGTHSARRVTGRDARGSANSAAVV